MHRFFVSPEALRADRVTLTGAQARQIASVLRLRTGDEIALVADGAEAVVALETVRPTSVIAVVRERGFTRVTLCGLATDFCVAWTALDAHKLGFDAAVIDDACRAIDMQGSLAAAWEKMKKAGVKRIPSADIV